MTRYILATCGAVAMAGTMGAAQTPTTPPRPGSQPGQATSQTYSTPAGQSVTYTGCLGAWNGSLSTASGSSASSPSAGSTCSELVVERGHDRQQRAVHALQPADLHVGHEHIGQHGRQRSQRVGGGQPGGVGLPPPAVRLERQLQPVHEPARARHGRARERIVQRDDFVFARQQHVAEQHGSVRSVGGADLHGHEHSGRRRELPIARRDVATATSDLHPGAASARRTSRAAPSP